MLNQVFVSHAPLSPSIDMLSIGGDHKITAFANLLNMPRKKKEPIAGADGKFFKDRLKEAMVYAGIPATDKGSELGRRLDLNRQTTNKWLNDENSPELSMVFLIAQSLGVDPLWLALGDRSMVPSDEPVSPSELEVLHIYRRLHQYSKSDAEAWVQYGVEKTELAKKWRIPTGPTRPGSMGKNSQDSPTRTKKEETKSSSSSPKKQRGANR